MALYTLDYAASPETDLARPPDRHARRREILKAPIRIRAATVRVQAALFFQIPDTM